MTAAILAVGSELLSGQTTNRNASWISSRLSELGIQTGWHAVVDDVQDQIVEALRLMSERASLIFVTGGLGPTTDDLTRNAVAAFAGRQLRYDESSWTHITSIFKKFGRPVAESNRQQCFFPEGSTVLTNQAGTANGFFIECSGIPVWVLPGPPREVEAVWNDHIAGSPRLRSFASDSLTRFVARTIGIGESNLGELVAGIMGKEPVSIAYRAHAPYVETKIIYAHTDEDRLAPFFARLREAVSKWLHEIGDQDIAAEFAHRLKAFRTVDIYDGATRGHLGEYITRPMRKTFADPSSISLVTSFESHDEPREFLQQFLSLNSSASCALGVSGFDASGQWAAGVRIGDRTEMAVLPSVYKGQEVQDRNLMAVGWVAVRTWLDLIGSFRH